METIMKKTWIALLVASCALAGSPACGGSSDKAAGDEGGKCYPNGTCNGGLSCFSKLCVRNAVVGSPDGHEDHDAGPDASTELSCSAVGTWDVSFQWSGRTPGELVIDVSDKSVNVHAGPGVMAQSGTVTFDTGKYVAWQFPDKSVWSATMDASCCVTTMGMMLDASNNVGSFMGRKNASGCSSGSSQGDDGPTGCTADADCRHCERCERSTGMCLTRLTCN
jgi:hypothetical protein